MHLTKLSIAIIALAMVAGAQSDAMTADSL